MVASQEIDAPQAGEASSPLGKLRALRLSALLAPRNRLKLGAALLVAVAAIALASLLFPAPSGEPVPLDNAIWLDRAWAYGEQTGGRLAELTGQMAENQVGKAYAFISSLGADNRWSGGSQGNLSFMEVSETIGDFVADFKSQDERLSLYAWIEIWIHLDADGYRLDDRELHANVADFSRLLVDQLGFDGVLLDVKPLFSDNDDLIRLIRRIRSAIGAEKAIAVALTADLTPIDAQLQAIPAIAPGTMWSPSFKQRLLLSADEVVLLMYQSYRQQPLDYVNWIAYHVETYINLLETPTNIVISIPNYSGASSAHNPAIETMATALDGLREGLRRLDEEGQALLTGVAIYSDKPLSPAEWNTFREFWLER